MNEIIGRKIFVLYPDLRLRRIFHGNLRDQFEIYYIYDYEKIPLLAGHFPGCILCLNLVDNDLAWLPGELEDMLEPLDAETRPRIIVLHNSPDMDTEHGDHFIEISGNDDGNRLTLQLAFDRYGGKGRRNLVRYGGGSESVASIEIECGGKVYTGTVHDISASGLSCSLPGSDCGPPSGYLNFHLDLQGKRISCVGKKILERKHYEDIINVFQFGRDLPEEMADAIYEFIHSSLDAEMAELIKSL